jgi:uncharacterized protein Yka (UPF0111/DUF47 family)
MASDTAETVEEQILFRTTEFVSELTACADAVTRLLEEYGAGAALDETVEDVGRHETACDRICRELTGLISALNSDRAQPGLLGVYLNAGQTLQLFQQLDEIANALERFADQLAAMRPPESAEVFDGLADMASYARAAMVSLGELTSSFVQRLCRADDVRLEPDIVDELRALETKSDIVRNEIVATAFETEDTQTALVYRELALMLDDALDAIEDAVDQMTIIAGRRPAADPTE